VRKTQAERAASHNILVLGDGAGALLGVVRSLGRRGLKVHVGGSSADNVTLASRYITKIHQLPLPSSGDWLRSVLELCAYEQIHLVLPCNDPNVFLVQKYREDIEALSQAYTISEQAFRIFFDKILTYELARSLRIPIPKYVVLRSSFLNGEVENAMEAIRLPAVIKPASSYTYSDLENRNKVFICQNIEEYKQTVLLFDRKIPIIVQDYFKGNTASLTILAKSGKVLTVFQHYSVREYQGVSSYRVSVPPNKELLRAAEAIVEAVSYTGVAMFEYRIDHNSGEWVLLEINGRFPASLPFAISAGADLPYFLYEMLLLGKTEFPRDYRTGIYGRNLKAELNWLIKRLRDPDSVSSARKYFPISIARQTLNAVSFRDYMDVLVLDDLKPGFREFIGLVGRLGRRFGASND
jgi:predicted ATP-grasp superfamily ATP-dependent carboligase